MEKNVVTSANPSAVPGTLRIGLRMNKYALCALNMRGVTLVVAPLVFVDCSLLGVWGIVL